MELKSFLITISNIQGNKVSQTEDTAQTIKGIYKRHKKEFKKLENVGHTIEVIEL